MVLKNPFWSLVMFENSFKRHFGTKESQSNLNMFFWSLKVPRVTVVTFWSPLAVMAHACCSHCLQHHLQNPRCLCLRSLSAFLRTHCVFFCVLGPAFLRTQRAAFKRTRVQKNTSCVYLGLRFPEHCVLFKLRFYIT